MKIILYTGPQCSLCDLAIDIVEQYNELNASEPLVLSKVNIRDSADLYHLYGARIPVLKNTENASELGWPFTIDDLVEFLK
ncbi:glutaredoxin family protein [Glaciecola sp.]|uniref:glutaredoxin family protein n=1 Tax=Glaciecola sp. MF2-115 TaxID=3384827 RepID=UPI0039896F17